MKKIKLRFLQDRKKYVRFHRWYWYKLIPFVVADVKNHEWEKIPKLKEFTSLKQIYNYDGGWYILENPLFWYLGVGSEFCLYDSLHMEHRDMSEDHRWLSMIEYAKCDIDEFWEQTYLPIIWKTLKSGLSLTLISAMELWKSIVGDQRDLKKK